MSSSYVSAVTPLTKEQTETETPLLELNFALFFYKGNNSYQLCHNMATCYKQGKNVRHYELLLEVKGTQNLAMQESDDEDEAFAKAVSDTVYQALKNIEVFLSGFRGNERNLTLYFDVFGSDLGLWPALCFCGLIDKGKVNVSESYIYEYCMADNFEGGIIGDFSMAGSKVVLNSYSFLETDDEVVLNIAISTNNYKHQEKKKTQSCEEIEEQISYLEGKVVENVYYLPITYRADFKDVDIQKVLDNIQTALDFAGMFPAFGFVPDLLNAGISACRGNWIDAGFSLAAAVPGIGDAATAAKYAKRVGKAVSKSDDMSNVIKAEERFATKRVDSMKQATKRNVETPSLNRYREIKEAKKSGKLVEILEFNSEEIKLTGTYGNVNYVESKIGIVKTDATGNITINCCVGGYSSSNKFTSLTVNSHSVQPASGTSKSNWQNHGGSGKQRSGGDQQPPKRETSHKSIFQEKQSPKIDDNQDNMLDNIEKLDNKKREEKIYNDTRIECEKQNSKSNLEAKIYDFLNP